MNKKFISPSKNPAYKPAELKILESRTYINIYYITKKGKYVHKKPTFKLGLIKDIAEKRKRGEEIVSCINWWLSNGYFFEDFKEMKAVKMMQEEAKKIAQKREREALAEKIKNKYNTNIVEAIKKAKKTKFTKTKKHSPVITYRSISKMFIEYLKIEKLTHLKCVDFNRPLAMEYLLWYKENRGIRNSSYNTIRDHNKSLWTELKILGYAKKNPYSGIPDLQEEDPIRRSFEDDEAAAVLKYAYKNDRLLLYAIVLDYICFARPVEVAKIKFEDINVEEGYIRIKADSAKSSTLRYAGIPDEFKPIFEEEFFKKYPSDYFVFGAYFKPNNYKSVNKASISRRHRLLLDEMFEKELLLAREGLQFYSWKMIGITHFIEIVGLFAAQQQAGHKYTKTTVRYVRKEKVNKKVAGFKNNIINIAEMMKSD